MRILHVDSSPLGAASVSRLLTAEAVTALRDANPGAAVTYRDLAADPVGHQDGAQLAARQADPATVHPAVRAEAVLTDRLIAEFLAADFVVIGAPMFNFSVPSQLKTWLDRLCQSGRTFRYTRGGPVGLAGGRAVILVSTRGASYGDASPMDYQEGLVRTVMGFIGVDDVRVVRAEGLSLGAGARERAIAEARANILSAVGAGPGFPAGPAPLA